MGLRLGATTTTTTTAAATPLASTTDLSCRRYRQSFSLTNPSPRQHPRFFSLRVLGESKETDLSTDCTSERSKSDTLVDGMNFGELCDDFECISSPAVEATARQLAKDILELREGNRALGSFSVSVKYKDPVRSFTGREKYKRRLWATDALQNPVVTIQEMVMLSTSVLSIKWTIKGKTKGLNIVDLIVRVNSIFTLNQISGQVIGHEESWDISSSPPIAQGYFWFSRCLFSATESVKDAVDLVKNTASRFSMKEENQEFYPDPTGDPTKFFQRDESLQRDAYQVAILLALVYFVVQFLKSTL